MKPSTADLLKAASLKARRLYGEQFSAYPPPVVFLMDETQPVGARLLEITRLGKLPPAIHVRESYYLIAMPREDAIAILRDACRPIAVGLEGGPPKDAIEVVVIIADENPLLMTLGSATDELRRMPVTGRYTKTSGSSGDDELDETLTRSLVATTLRLVKKEYDEILSTGVTDPAIILVDCEDEIGSKLARSWDSDADVDAAIENRLGGSTMGSTTVRVLGVDFATAKGRFLGMFPHLASTFIKPRERDYLTMVVVTQGQVWGIELPLSELVQT